MTSVIQRMDETCIIQRWISKRVYLFRMFGESRPTYGGVKVQESRMRENFMYGLTRGQRKRSDGQLERDTRSSRSKITSCDVRLPERPVREKR